MVIKNKNEYIFNVPRSFDPTKPSIVNIFALFGDNFFCSLKDRL